MSNRVCFNNLKYLLKRVGQIENLYMKFILTVIAITLVFIAVELTNRNFYSYVDIINGSIGVDGTVQVSGEIDTYEQNTIIGRKHNH